MPEDRIEPQSISGCDCPVGSGEGAWREEHAPDCATQRGEPHPRCRHAAAGATGPVLFCVLPRGHDEPHRAASGAEWTERLTIDPGTVVLTQHGGVEHRGLVLDEVHPLPGWVWVEWEHIGRADEAIEDLTVAS